MTFTVQSFPCDSKMQCFQISSKKITGKFLSSETTSNQVAKGHNVNSKNFCKLLNMKYFISCEITVVTQESSFKYCCFEKVVPQKLIKGIMGNDGVT